MTGTAEEEPAGAEAPPAGVARRGPTWVILAVVAAALLVCCCSAVIGLVVAWSAGILTTR
ncbi:hypothetical protein [Micromonospora sp. NPDC007230]|uniref:hypothetical protein n=1 Tax=Micromonospora sp. NPDC007230 TaxID=3364237 RepID=UPI00367EDA83